MYIDPALFWFSAGVISGWIALGAAAWVARGRGPAAPPAPPAPPVPPSVITLDGDSIQALAEATAREADHYRLYGSRS